jgi:hypothetical protein
MGEGRCIVVEHEGRVLGVLGAALRVLIIPGGHCKPVVYLGDMKIDPAARGGRTMLRLVEGMRFWVGTRAESAYAVVMDGTPVTPTRYTGRLGIPQFQQLGKIVILRLPKMPGGGPDDWMSTEERGMACYHHWSAKRYACGGGNSDERSEMKPIWLVEPGGRACGRLEDTRRAKRLIADDGTEMVSAHLSCFAYENVSVGVDLIRRALRCIVAPALFVAVPDSEVEPMARRLPVEAVRAPATIYGTGVPFGPEWSINTAEI